MYNHIDANEAMASVTSTSEVAKMLEQMRQRFLGPREIRFASKTLLASLLVEVNRYTGVGRFGNVGLRISDNQLVLRGTDSNMMFEIRLDSELPEENPLHSEQELFLKVSSLKKYIAAIAAKTEFSIGHEKVAQPNEKEPNVFIKTGNSCFTFNPEIATQFPEHDLKLEETYELKNFYNIISQLAYCMSKEETRYYLNGLFLEFEEGLLRWTSTDGHRLAQATTLNAQATPNKKGVIVPAQLINAALAFSKKYKDKDVSLSLSFCEERKKTLVTIQGKNWKASQFYIEGSFPDYKQTIPKTSSANATIVLDTQEALKAAIMAIAASPRETGGARFTVSEEQIVTLYAQDSSKGNFKHTFKDATTTGSAIECGYNMTYWKETLEQIPTPKIKVHLTNSLAPALIESYADNEEEQSSGSCIHVCMPMRL